MNKKSAIFTRLSLFVLKTAAQEGRQQKELGQGGDARSERGTRDTISGHCSFHLTTSYSQYHS